MTKEKGKQPSRPLKKRVDAGLSWIMQVRGMLHQSGLSFPVFEWRFRSELVWAGTVQAWFQGFFIFRDRRESSELRFDKVEDLLVRIDTYGWGEPPYIDEIFLDITETRQMFPVRTVEEAQRILQQLQQKWENLINDYQTSKAFWEEKLIDVNFDL